MKRIYKSGKFRISLGIKSSLVYTVASFFSKGLSLITIPLFTRLIPSSEMGIVNIYNSWYSIISVIASLALTSGGFQLAMKEFKDERCQYISSILTLTSGVAVLIGFVFISSLDFWEHTLGLRRPLILLLIAHLLFYPAYDCWLMWQKYEYKYIASGFVSILSALFAVCISVWAVITASSAGIKDLGIIRLLSNYIVLLSIAFVFWIYFFVKGKTFFSGKYWHFSLALSLPLIANSFAAQILNVSDRIMIGRIVDNRSVGIYGTIYTTSSAFLIIWNAINTSFVPFLYNNIEVAEKNAQIKRISTTLFMIISVSALLLTLTAPEIVKLMAPKEYYEAIYIMPPIAAGVFLTAVSNMYSNILIYHKQTKYIMISTIVAATTNLVLNYYGIHSFGYMAAAYTTLIAYIIHAFIQAMVSIRVHRRITGNSHHTVYETKIIFVISLITICTCIMCVFLYQMVFIRYLILIIIIIILYVKRKFFWEFFIVKES